MTAIPETLSEVLSALQKWDPTTTAALPPINVSFLRNYSLENSEPFLKLASFNSGFQPKIDFGNYDSIRQDLMSADTVNVLAQKDLVVFSLHPANFIPRFWANEWDTETYRAELDSLLSLCRKVKLRKVALTSLILPFHSELGPVLPTAQSDLTSKVEALNETLREASRECPETFVYLDWNRIIRQVGFQDSIDTRYWYLSQAPFRPAFLAKAMAEIGGIVRATKGLTKKCLVLDCDNTLWGGVIGEEGLTGIKLGPESEKGRAFFDFQCTVKALKNRGIVLALCSKNNEADAWEVFDSHPHRMLTREDFSASRINWSGKAQNIVDIARELNIGLNSLVFVDDSPVECELVSRELPDVTVLRVPEKTHLLPNLLWSSGLFDTTQVSKEDLSRTTMYREQKIRIEERNTYQDIETYLVSLDQVARIHPLLPTELVRTAQLTQKTNQFNFTTKRYTEAEVEQMSRSDDHLVLTMQVRDRHGDSGLTGVMILKRENSTCSLDTFLMSCRILSRRLEFAFLQKALSLARERWGVSQFRGVYFPTAKNAQVSDFWDRVGMNLVEQQNEAKQYEIPIELVKYPSLNFISVEE